MSEPAASAPHISAHRRVSPALGLGVLVLPVVFIWFLFRAGYTVRAQIVACLWMGLVGIALMLSAPNWPWSGSARRLVAAQPLKPPPVPIETLVHTPAGWDFKVGETRSVYRLLRTPVSLKNVTHSGLGFTEASCVFYSADGALLGNGLANWASVGRGEAVSGEVVASNIDLSKVRRRTCKVRTQ